MSGSSLECWGWSSESKGKLALNSQATVSNLRCGLDSKMNNVNSKHSIWLRKYDPILLDLEVPPQFILVEMKLVTGFSYRCWYISKQWAMACLIIYMYRCVFIDALIINVVLKCLTSYHFRYDKQVNGANTSCLSCNACPVQSGRWRAGQYHFSSCNWSCNPLCWSVLPTSSIYSRMRWTWRGTEADCTR